MATNGFRLPMGDNTARLVFDHPDYKGAEVVVRTALPLGIFMKIQKLSAEKSLDGFTTFGDEVLVEWNVQDKKGNPIPATGEGMEEIYPEFALLMTDQRMRAVTDINGPLEQPSSGGSTLARER